jgi:hypothetical protein
MRSEHAKGAEEIKVFLRFVQAVDFPIAATSIEKRDPPEPDLRCIHAIDGPITFELVELCDRKPCEGNIYVIAGVHPHFRSFSSNYFEQTSSQLFDESSY